MVKEFPIKPNTRYRIVIQGPNDIKTSQSTRYSTVKDVLRESYLKYRFTTVEDARQTLTIENVEDPKKKLADALANIGIPVVSPTVGVPNLSGVTAPHEDREDKVLVGHGADRWKADKLGLQPTTLDPNDPLNAHLFVNRPRGY